MSNGRIPCFVKIVTVALIACASAGATVVKIRTTTGGPGVEKVLVITISLTSGIGEVGRDLTARGGYAPVLDLKPGFYEVIAIHPYGYWKTQVRDFEVADKPLEIELQLEGEIADIIPALIDLTVRVTDQQGRAISNAWVDGMASDGTSHSFARTDEHGEAKVRIPLDGAQVTVIYRGVSHIQEVDIPSGVVACERACVDRELSRLEAVKKLPPEPATALRN